MRRKSFIEPTRTTTIIAPISMLERMKKNHKHLGFNSVSDMFVQSVREAGYLSENEMIQDLERERLCLKELDKEREIRLHNIKALEKKLAKQENERPKEIQKLIDAILPDPFDPALIKEHKKFMRGKWGIEEKYYPEYMQKYIRNNPTKAKELMKKGMVIGIWRDVLTEYGANYEYEMEETLEKAKKKPKEFKNKILKLALEKITEDALVELRTYFLTLKPEKPYIQDRVYNP